MDEEETYDVYSIAVADKMYSEVALRSIMNQILRIKGSGNLRCAECDELDPQWASVNLAINLCIGCSTVHRNMGANISKVRSLFLEPWKKDELEHLKLNGNKAGKLKWEAKFPPFFEKPRPNDSAMLKEYFIRAKYEHKEYVYNSEACYYGRTPAGLPKREGLLIKQGGQVKNWKKRTFVLLGSVLTYYKTVGSAAGAIHLKDMLSVDCNTTTEKKFCFSIKTGSRTWFFVGEDDKDVYDWVMALRMIKYALCKNYQPNAKKKAVDVDPKEILPTFSSHMPLEKRKLDGKAYSSAFYGACAVDWLLVNCDLTSREEAVVVGQKMITSGLIKSLGEDKFEDNVTSLYSFPGTNTSSGNTATNALRKTNSMIKMMRTSFSSSNDPT
eukprot:TRINITY_DN7052_c0_g1_i1.p1 TRINITY_DN7052_c0_g1~~TRINITY_DN7052_c0_g1_i1.p1  ORF type:complete len:384 (-),score=104.49 TRINITY_DN7052_c0_g1_i1:40-1191(-)